MPPQQALERLSRALANNPAVTVIVASEPDAEVGVVLQRLTLRQELAAEFREAAQSAVPPANEDLILKPYDPGYRQDSHELVYIELAQQAEIAEQVRQISDVQNTELFHENDDVVDHLRFYGIVASPNARQHAVFFRTYSPKKELTRSARFAALFSRGAYDKVKSRIFLFDHNVDCFAWDGYLFIRNVSAFQRIFKYFEELRARADETVDAVVARIPISNLEDFRAAGTGQMQMMSKLAQIARKPYLNQVTMRDIKRAIEEFGLDVQVVRDHGQEKLLFEPGLKKRWLILKLLDDDYLGSIMTKQKYEVNSKSALA
jgi:hypothetical protein